MRVHTDTAAVQQDRSVVAVACCAVYGPADRWRQRDQDHLGALAAHPQDPVTVLFPEVIDVSAGGFEDPQAEQPEHGYQREVLRVR
jgi:hypothetical protein